MKLGPAAGAALVAMLVVRPAWAQPAAPAATPAPTATPAFGVLGNWGGGRAALAQRGVDVFGRYVGEFAANPSGGFQQGTAFASEFQLGTNVDFSKLTGARSGGVLTFIFTQRWGSGLSTNTIGNIGSVQEIYGDGLTARLTELDYTQPIGSAVSVRFGRVIMQNDFAASTSYWNSNLWCFYQSNAICGTPLGAPNNSGYGYYPSSEWGARVKVQSPVFYAETGVYQVNPVYAQRGQGFNLGFYGSTGVDIPLETGVTLRDASGMMTGNVRIGGYYDTSDVVGAESNLSRFVQPTNPALGFVPTQTYRGRSGGWFLFDHLLAGSSRAGQRGTAFWAAYEYGDPQTALMSNFFDLGIVQHGTFPGRPNDSLALGYDYIDVNNRLRVFENALQAAGFTVPTNGQERALEINYGIAVGPGISLRPGFQYVFNPAGEIGNYVYPGGFVGIPNAPVFGLQTILSF